MIDLTPLDVRKKRGDFAKALRGYDAEEVDTFLELVSERMEEIVKENLKLVERTDRLSEQVSAQEGREKAVQEALVTAQTLREDVKQQALREAEVTQREAQTAIDQVVAEAERMLDERRKSLGELERHRLRFLKSFRMLLEREMDTVEVEESRTPLEDVPFDIDLGAVVERTGDAGATEEEAIPPDEIAEVPVEADDDAITVEADGEEAAEEHDGEDAEARVEEEVAIEEEVAAEEEAEPEEVAAEEVEPAEPDEPAESSPDVDDPEGEEPAPGGERGGVAKGDDDSLWLNSLLDGESRDEGKWS